METVLHIWFEVFFLLTVDAVTTSHRQSFDTLWKSFHFYPRTIHHKPNHSH